MGTHLKHVCVVMDRKSVCIWKVCLCLGPLLNVPYESWVYITYMYMFISWRLHCMYFFLFFKKMDQVHQSSILVNLSDQEVDVKGI